MSLKALAIIGLPLAGGFVSSLLAPTRSSWYDALKKPAWNPPGWLFGPVWSLLYLTMGVASYLVFRQRASPQRTLALAIFYTQLIINLAWSPIFFGMRKPAVAFAVILVLWLLIVATVITFYKVQKVAALLLLPYLAWVTFATVLNKAIVSLNP
jgi:translocator protein